MAECSLSTGSRRTPLRRAAAMTSSPPATRVSLFAKATSCPASMADRVGSSPTIPTTALSTRSVSSSAASSHSPSIPDKILTGRSLTRMRRDAAAASSKRAANGGRKRRSCSSSIRSFEPAARACTGYPSEAATSSAWVPMDPVEPSTARRLGSAAEIGRFVIGYPSL